MSQTEGSSEKASRWIFDSPSSRLP